MFVPALRVLLSISLVSLLGACVTTPMGQSAAKDLEAAATLTRQQITDLVANPERSAADRINDVRRQPINLLDFIGIRPGMTVVDLSAGGGYTTELLARAVGPSGRVVGQSAPPKSDDRLTVRATPEGAAFPVAPVAAPEKESAAPVVRRPSFELINERASRSRLTSMIPLVRAFETPIPPELASSQLDLVTLMFNYHDLGHLGVDRAAMNAAVFAALKHGGMYVIADHAGRTGTGISEAGTLHRIEESFLRHEVTMAGFVAAAEADFLRNPADPRDRNIPEPPQPKDDFVLKFIKP